MKLKLQNLVYPSTDTCTEEQLYFRRDAEEGDKIAFSWANNQIAIQNTGFVSFDTYFNSFSIEKWAKYTHVKKVILHLRLSGNVRVTLMRKEKHFDEIHTEYVGEVVCRTRTSKPEEFVLSFDTVSTTGMYCFALVGLAEQSVFYDGYYAADLPEAVLRHIKIAIDICTFRRERFIQRNLENLNRVFLQNPNSYLYDKLEVFISDNAKTLDIPALSTDKIHIVQNKNVGGAGGFTRGMIEIQKVREERGITHILVTDDDILYEPESIFRTCTFLSCVKEAYQDIFVGGAMLRLDTQYIQTESGAIWDSGFLVSRKNGLDLRLLENCLFNEMEETTQFNAWWFCAFPAEIVREDNLPMPIFIRGDDVEYGLRNLRHLALLNGICVWHEPFENKYSSAMSYYIFRNRLIDNALHHMNMPPAVLKRELEQFVMNEVRLYRYKNAHLLLQGVEDFFKGVDWLRQQDGEQLHQLIMKAGYRLQYPEDLPEKIPFHADAFETARTAVPPSGIFGILHRIIAHFTWNGTKLSVKKPVAVVPTEGVQQISVYRAGTVLNYDYCSRKAFVTRKDLREAKYCVQRLKQCFREIDKNYLRVTQEYAQRGKELQTLAFWEQYLELGKETECI